MVDVANLKVNVESGSARKAKGDLDALEKSAGRLGSSMIKSMKQAENGVQGLINKTVGLDKTNKSAKASANVFTAAVDKERNAVRKLQAALDPTIAAKQRLETQTEQLNRALRQGIITQEEYNRTLTQARAQYDATTSALARMNAANAGSAKGKNRLASAATQAGFQVQDFAIQVSAGTNAMLALNQQLPQLLGAFGSFGKIALFGSLLGTVAAVAGAIIPKMLEMRDKVNVAAKSIEGLEEAVDDYRAATNKALADQESMVESYGVLAEGAREYLGVLREIEEERALSANQGQAQANVGAAFDGSTLNMLGMDRLADAISGELTRNDLLRERQELTNQFYDTQNQLTQAEAQAMNERFKQISEQISQMDRVQDAVDAVTERFDVQGEALTDLLGLFKNVGEADNIEERNAAYSELVEFLKSAKEEGAEFNAEGQSLYETLVKSALEGAELEHQMNGGKNAAENMKEAVEEWKEHVIEGKIAVTEFKEEVWEAYRAGKDFSDLKMDEGIWGAVTAAEALAERMGISLSLAQKLANQSAMSEGQKLIGSKISAGLVPGAAAADLGLTSDGSGGFMVDPQGEEITGSPRSYSYKPDKPEKEKKKGRGGKTEAEKEMNKLLKEREQIILRSKDGQTLYNEAVENLNRIQGELGLSTEVYQNELDELSQKYLNAGGAAEFFDQQQMKLQQAIVGMIVRGESLKDTLMNIAQAIAEAALQAALFGTGPMANMFGGGSFFGAGGAGMAAGGGEMGIVASLLSGFFATGTKNAPGGLAVVGEQGPELVNLPKGSEVTPTQQTNQMMNQKPPSTNVNVTPNIVNVMDPALVGDYLSTTKGEQMVVNIMQKNQGGNM